MTAVITLNFLLVDGSITSARMIHWSLDATLTGQNDLVCRLSKIPTWYGDAIIYLTRACMALKNGKYPFCT